MNSKLFFTFRGGLEFHSDLFFPAYSHMDVLKMRRHLSTGQKTEFRQDSKIRGLGYLMSFLVILRASVDGTFKILRPDKWLITNSFKKHSKSFKITECK